MNKHIRLFLLIVAVVVGYYGFRFVTQAGQGLDAVQNDGYGGTGGFMILVSGYIIGYLTTRNEKK